jgi:hypothetical protein
LLFSNSSATSSCRELACVPASCMQPPSSPSCAHLLTRRAPSASIPLVSSKRPCFTPSRVPPGPAAATQHYAACHGHPGQAPRLCSALETFLDVVIATAPDSPTKHCVFALDDSCGRAPHPP